MIRDQRRVLLVLVVLAAIGGVVLYFLTRPAEDRGLELGDPAAGDGHGGASGGAGSAGSGGAAIGDRPEVAVPAPRRPLTLSRARVEDDVSAPGGVLRGEVLSFGSGQPIAGAELVFAFAGRTRAVRSDEHGGFELAVDQEGTYTLALATAEGFLPYAPDWGHSPVSFQARPGKRVDGVRVFLTPAVTYTAVVLDADDEPVEGAEVRLLGAATGTTRLSPLPDRFVTDEAGEVRLSAPDGAVLEARHDDHGRARGAVDNRAQISHRITLRFGQDDDSLTGAETIAGRVVDADGEPIPGARLVADPLRREPGAPLHPAIEAEAGDDGSFELSGLDRSRYVVSASHPGYSRAAVEAEAGERDVALELGDEVRLTGRVVVAGSGDPVASFGVVVQRSHGALEREYVASASAFAADGSFVVPGLSPGEYVVRAAASGYATSPEVAVTLPEPPAEAPEIVLEVAQGGVIAGRVTDTDSGEPLHYARVSLEGALGDGAEVVPLRVTEVTDEDGRYELHGVAAGLRSITAAAADHHSRIRSGIQVPEGGRVVVDVDLSATEEGEEPRTEMAGIGAVLATEGDVLMITRVLDGGGAKEAGLAAGDAIVEVDGQPAGELGFGGAIEAIRGPEGTRIRLLVLKAGADATAPIDVPRRRIRF